MKNNALVAHSSPSSVSSPKALPCGNPIEGEYRWEYSYHEEDEYPSRAEKFWMLLQIIGWGITVVCMGLALMLFGLVILWDLWWFPQDSTMLESYAKTFSSLECFMIALVPHGALIAGIVVLLFLLFKIMQEGRSQGPTATTAR